MNTWQSSRTQLSKRVLQPYCDRNIGRNRTCISMAENCTRKSYFMCFYLSQWLKKLTRYCIVLHFVCQILMPLALLIDRSWQVELFNLVSVSFSIHHAACAMVSMDLTLASQSAVLAISSCFLQTSTSLTIKRTRKYAVTFLITFVHFILSQLYS